MGKIAFMFSGQGAQKAGMGRDFYDSLPLVRELFDYCDVVRPGTLDQCFYGTDEVLKDTANTQPCLYLADIAAAIAAKEAGIKPDALAGFSLGEIPALAFGGAYSYESGFRIAASRGCIMGKEAAKTQASMMAVVKLPDEKVEELCSKYDSVYPVNYNAPGQLTVAGRKDQLESLKADVKAAGGRGIPLNVSGGFHSPFMDGASKKFGAYLENVEMQSPNMRVFSDYTGDIYAPDEKGVKQLLEKQINNPVRWSKIIMSLATAGYDTFIETGVGNVLKNLVGKMLPDAKTFSIQTMEDVESAVKELGL